MAGTLLHVTIADRVRRDLCARGDAWRWLDGSRTADFRLGAVLVDLPYYEGLAANGLRMALGARYGNIVWLMLRRVVLLVALGVVVGVGGALALTRLIESMLWNITPNDPATFAGAAILLILVALAAGFLPARRAARIHPMEALRSE